jgi:hypothetical protein
VHKFGFVRCKKNKEMNIRNSVITWEGLTYPANWIAVFNYCSNRSADVTRSVTRPLGVKVLSAFKPENADLEVC